MLGACKCFDGRVSREIGCLAHRPPSGDMDTKRLKQGAL